jgi:ribosomal protein S18 acetylase RimI-like enzyme
MQQINIKTVTLADAEELQKISRQTFYETFSAQNTAANMKKYLAENLSLAKLSAELKDKNAEFYFACSGGQVIGYLKINTGTSQTVLQDEQSLEIERIYVVTAYHGKKVGQLLLEKALQRAKQQNAGYVWLGVWEQNSKAIQFYKKNGFVGFDKHIFKLGDDEQTDIMMKKNLTPTPAVENKYVHEDPV